VERWSCTRSTRCASEHVDPRLVPRRQLHLAGAQVCWHSLLPASPRHPPFVPSCIRRAPRHVHMSTKATAPNRHCETSYGHVSLQVAVSHTLAGRVQLAGLGPVQLEHLQLPQPCLERARRPLHVCLAHRVRVLGDIRRPGCCPVCVDFSV
jgi:hypothetical protein